MNKQKKYKLKRVKRQHSFKKIETIIRKQSRKMTKKKKKCTKTQIITCVHSWS